MIDEYNLKYVKYSTNLKNSVANDRCEANHHGRCLRHMNLIFMINKIFTRNEINLTSSVVALVVVP
jgi:hypothetical protein